VKLQPDSEEAVTTLAYLYNELGDTARATQVLSSVPNTERSAKLYSALGYTYEQQKQYKEAIEAYRHAIELDRDNLDAIRGLAQNLLNDGQADAALEQYKVIADANPEDAQTYVRIAEIYRKQGKFDLALDNLKKAESMVQDSLEVPYNIAAIYQAQGRYDEAIPIMRDLLKKSEKPDGKYSNGEKSNRAVFLERLGRSTAIRGTIRPPTRLSARSSPWAETTTSSAAISRLSIPGAKPRNGRRLSIRLQGSGAEAAQPATEDGAGRRSRRIWATPTRRSKTFAPC
jgi:tetratricopeptide (TPR) repeat protein